MFKKLGAGQVLQYCIKIKFINRAKALIISKLSGSLVKTKLRIEKSSLT